MTLTVRKAAAEDLPLLMKIYENARMFMQAHGNPRLAYYHYTV